MKGSSPVGALSLYTAGGPQEAVHADVSMARILSLWEISPRAAWTDQEQPELMAADLQGTVFRCWANIAETVIHSEIGSSVAIREAGFNLDSLMLRYQVTPCCYCCTRQAINPLHQPTPCISIPYTWSIWCFGAPNTPCTLHYAGMNGGAYSIVFGKPCLLYQLSRDSAAAALSHHHRRTR